MCKLNQKFGKLNPGYLSEFKKFIESHSQFGGGGVDEKYIKAKSFSSAYEFYIYSFFIGLYQKERFDFSIEDKLTTFWEVENWKPKPLVDTLLACAIAESDFNMVEIEHMDDNQVARQIKLVQREIEAYANGGLRFLQKEFTENPELYEDDMYFIKLLSA
jgi:hypothetical protein